MASWILIFLSFFFEFCATSGTRGHAYKLFKSHCNSGVRSQFFAERVVRVWNSLPTSTNFATLPVFRQSIMRVDFSAFLKVFNFTFSILLLSCLDAGTLFLEIVC